MNTHVSFHVYGPNLGVLEQEAIAELARFSDTDFQWNVSMEITSTVLTGDASIRHWKAEVSAYPKPSSGWQGGS